MASPKSHTVSRLVLYSLTVRAPSLVTHSDSEGSCREQEGLRFMWQTIGLHQGKQRGGCLRRPTALCCISGFFFSLLLQTALNFLLDLVSPVKKCHPKGPAEMLSGPASLKKANNLFAHKEWKKCFCASKITEHSLSKMNQFLPAGIISTNWENKAITIQSPTTRFQKRPHVLTVSCSFSWPGLSHCFPKCGLRATYIRIMKIKESLLLEKEPVVCDF